MRLTRAFAILALLLPTATVVTCLSPNGGYQYNNRRHRPQKQIQRHQRRPLHTSSSFSNENGLSSSSRTRRQQQQGGGGNLRSRGVLNGP